MTRGSRSSPRSRPFGRLIHEHQGLENWSSSGPRQVQGAPRPNHGLVVFRRSPSVRGGQHRPVRHAWKANWRATCWEIHPITDIQLLEESK